MSNDDARVEGSPRIEGGDVVFEVAVGPSTLRVFSNVGGVFHTGGLPVATAFDNAVRAANAYVTAHRAELDVLYKQIDAARVPPPSPGASRSK